MLYFQPTMAMLVTGDNSGKFSQRKTLLGAILRSNSEVLKCSILNFKENIFYPFSGLFRQNKLKWSISESRFSSKIFFATNYGGVKDQAFRTTFVSLNLVTTLRRLIQILYYSRVVKSVCCVYCLALQARMRITFKFI